MISILASLTAVFVLLVLAEFLRRKGHIRGEISRKFVHITVGSFVAFWPFFMTWNEIRIMCAAFLIVVLIDRHLHIFRSVHDVKRRTVGDILFPLGIGLATYVSSSPWIFSVAILHLSLGDGFAAIVGNEYGKKYSYTIFHQKKSLVGSITFWFVSLVLAAAMIWFMPLNFNGAALPLLLGLPILTAGLESVSIFGLDNITVPVGVALLLSSLLVV